MIDTLFGYCGRQDETDAILCTRSGSEKFRDKQQMKPNLTDEWWRGRALGTSDTSREACVVCIEWKQFVVYCVPDQLNRQQRFICNEDVAGSIPVSGFLDFVLNSLCSTNEKGDNHDKNF